MPHPIETRAEAGEVRAKCILILAKQLALHQHHGWNVISDLFRAAHITNAETMLATVERMAKVEWPS